MNVVLLRRWNLWLLFAVLWMVLQDAYNLGYFIAGLINGALILLLFPSPEVDYIRFRFTGIGGFFTWLPKALHMLFYFLWELLKANWGVAKLTLTPGVKLTPGILAMPLRVRQPGQIAMVANMITLTPGTISLDVDEKEHVLYIHAIDASDVEGALASCRRFEDLVMEVMA